MILDARKPRGKHIGCNLVHEIEPKEYVSTYQLDYTGLEKNKKLEIFSTAAKYNPYTWSNYTDMMNRRTKVLLGRISYVSKRTSDDHPGYIENRLKKTERIWKSFSE